MNRGLTLVEILIVVAILSLIGGFGIIVSANFYRNQSILADQSDLISLLRKARNSALNNLNESGHGVYIGADEYVVFQGDTYATRNTVFDEEYSHSGGLQFSGLQEITFQQLEGNANASGTIAVSNGVQTTTVSINSEGRIYW